MARLTRPDDPDPWRELDELAQPDAHGVLLPRREQFDEHRYLSDNPDVAAVVESGGFESGFSHWLAHGSAEGRRFADNPWTCPSDFARESFDEALYLGTFPDVTAAVVNRTLESGFEHWQLHGRKEGRPFPAKAVMHPVTVWAAAHDLLDSFESSPEQEPGGED